MKPHNLEDAIYALEYAIYLLKGGSPSLAALIPRVVERNNTRECGKYYDDPFHPISDEKKYETP